MRYMMAVICFEITGGGQLSRCGGNKIAELITVEARWWVNGGLFSPFWYVIKFSIKKKKECMFLVHSPQKSPSAVPGFPLMNDCASLNTYLIWSLLSSELHFHLYYLSIHRPEFLIFPPSFFYTCNFNHKCFRS